MNEERSTASQTALVLALISLLLMTAVLVLQHVEIGHTTRDSMRYQYHAVFKPVYFGGYQGRINQVIFYNTSTLPYFFNNPWYYHSLSLGAVFLALSLFTYLLFLLTRQPLFALVVICLFLAFLQNSWERSPLTSFTFSMHLAMSILIASFVLFVLSIDAQRKSLLIASQVLFLLALYAGFEYNTLYAALFLVIARARIGSWVRAARLSAICLIPMVIYVSSYLVFQKVKPPPNPYRGSEVALSMGRAADVMLQYSVSSLPTYHFFNFPEELDRYADTIEGHAVADSGFSLAVLLKHLRAIWLVKAICIAWLLVATLRNGLLRFSNSACLLLALTGLYLIVAPVFLLGFTPKYQEWVSQGYTLTSYSSYFSSFGTVLLLVVAMIWGHQQSRKTGSLLSGSATVLMAVTAAVGSLLNDYSNHYIFRSQMLSHQKWRAVDSLVEATDFPERGILYAPSLWSFHGLAQTYPEYWDKYFRFLHQKNDLVVTNDPAQLGGILGKKTRTDLYYLKYSQEERQPDQYIFLAPVSTDDSRLLASGKALLVGDRAELVSTSINRRFLVFGRVITTSQHPLVSVDHRTARLHGSYFAMGVDRRRDRGRSCFSVPVSCQGCLLDLQSLSLSNYVDQVLVDLTQAEVVLAGT